jgi:SulP family sulfate permease
MGFLLHSLPKAFLAALIIVSVFSLFDLRAWLEVWRYSLLEGISLLITFLGALWLGVEWGIAVGALAGVALYLWRTSRPRIVIEGRMGNSTAFRSLDRKEVEPEPSPVLVVRIDQDLYFANSGYCENQILKAVAEHQTLRVLVLDLKAVTEIDVSGSGMLKRLIRNLADAGISVSIAGATLPVTKALKNDGVSEIIGKEQFFVTVNEAASDLSASLEPEKSR